MPEVDYVTKEVFEMQVKTLKERDDSVEKICDARCDRIEALMEKTLEQIRTENFQLRTEFRSKMNEMQEDNAKFRAEVRSDIKEMKNEIAIMNVRIDKNLAEYKAIASEMQGNFRADVVRLEGRIETVNAKIDTLQNKFSWNIAWMGIIIGVVLAVIQHFWK